MLRPCIDFHGVNDITVKNHYPLPLISFTVEFLQAHQACPFRCLPSDSNPMDSHRTLFLGPQFISCFWWQFCKQLGASLSLSSGFHPQANGQTERYNHKTETTLRCFTSQNQSRWSPRFAGPISISKIITAVRLQLPWSTRAHPTFHTFWIKPFVNSHLLLLPPQIKELVLGILPPSYLPVSPFVLPSQ